MIKTFFEILSEVIRHSSLGVQANSMRNEKL